MNLGLKTEPVTAGEDAIALFTYLLLYLAQKPDILYWPVLYAYAHTRAGSVHRQRFALFWDSVIASWQKLAKLFWHVRPNGTELSKELQLEN